MKKNLPTLTIGIPAYNEANNINRVINTLLKQNYSSVKLDCIIVVSDGSSDKTVEIVSNIAKDDHRVQIVNGKARRGKNRRLNQLFKLAKSDYLICMDGDLLFSDKNLIEKICKGFNSDDVSLVSGNDIPLSGKGIINIFNQANYNLWYETRKNLNGGDSIHNIHGAVYGVKKNLYKKLRLEEGISADDHQVYFQAKKLNYKMVFSKEAKIYYIAPTKFNDLLKQSVRYIQPHQQIEKAYGAWVKNYYRVPRFEKIKSITYGLFTGKIDIIFVLIFQILIRIVAKFSKNTGKSGFWEVQESTKVTIK